ncbi:hypothetical protein MRX96_014275 [Rhipicephalus microplus]
MASQARADASATVSCRIAALSGPLYLLIDASKEMLPWQRSRPTRKGTFSSSEATEQQWHLIPYTCAALRALHPCSTTDKECSMVKAPAQLPSTGALRLYRQTSWQDIDLAVWVWASTVSKRATPAW